MDKKEYDRQYYQKNKECIKARTTEYRLAHKDQLRESIQRSAVDWKKRNPDKVKQIQKAYFNKNKEKIYARKRDWYVLNKERLTDYARRQKRQRHLEVKVSVLTHYGNGACQCVTCRDSRVDCLSIDHIANDGSKQRKSLQFRGNRFYYYLLRERLPSGYQTLCMNCQWIKKAQQQREKRKP